MEVKCVVCGKLFEKAKGRVERTKTGKHYCSRGCYQLEPISTQEKTGAEVICKTCGSVVYRSGYVIEHNPSGVFYCSKKCMGEDRKIKDTNSLCEFCGKPIWRRPGDIENGLRLYCSRECWKEGRKSKGVNLYRSFKDNTCSRCGFLPEDKCQLDVHHVDSNSGNHVEENLITLCANCHRLVHKEFRDSLQRENNN